MLSTNSMQQHMHYKCDFTPLPCSGANQCHCKMGTFSAAGQAWEVLAAEDLVPGNALVLPPVHQAALNRCAHRLPLPVNALHLPARPCRKALQHQIPAQTSMRRFNVFQDPAACSCDVHG